MSEALTWEEARELAYSVARGTGLKHETSEDLAQEVCLSLLESPPEALNRGIVALRTYARRANLAKRYERSVQTEQIDPHLQALVGVDVETRADIERALATLTQEQRAVIRDVILRGSSIREVARSRCRDFRSVHDMLARALRALERLLSAYA